MYNYKNKFKNILFIQIISLVLHFLSGTAFSCPTCFSGTNTEVLHTYYISAVMLILLPFGIIPAFANLGKTFIDVFPVIAPYFVWLGVPF